MNKEIPRAYKQVAMRIAQGATAKEKQAIRSWTEKLLALKAADTPALTKVRQAISITAESDVVLPVVKVIAGEMKRLAWDERRPATRLALGGAAVGLAIFGGQSAGVAALGTAIGVPLWVIFGAGATFLGVLYEEITDDKDEPKTTYTTIDAERKDD